jgi:hypothetical protein
MLQQQVYLDRSERECGVFAVFLACLFDLHTFPYEGGYVCGQFREQLVQVEE